MRLRRHVGSCGLLISPTAGKPPVNHAHRVHIVICGVRTFTATLFALCHDVAKHQCQATDTFLTVLQLDIVALNTRIHAVHAAVQHLIKAHRGGGLVFTDALPNGADDAEDLGAEGVDGEEDTFSSDEDT
ncbi:hypothetical protein SERLADRAFT_437650 [Serpula lacrymans var. lacrymans S7.9]|uniref:Uncharacterized protein n=1 Tax=Serpula lacrymans var. lacrymans (strain S7.9) TaxID=578457 RepID=F8NUS7_SERL9|nr:uncharacterized protein SERLADRAFT_437650 [Serpula lacrymans var. lacrymans S7.9]EGO25935.1 hypothetical protein SERLADRAFT_437650 [Serpula lacrymans var. lacrymans S7.9]